MDIRVRFQPIVDVLSKTVLGYESTMYGQYGENAPTLFDQAQTSSEVVELDGRAIDLSMSKGLKMLGKDQLLFVNVHPETIAQGFTFSRNITGLKNVVFEITEQATLSDNVRFKFETLQRTGAQFAIDDYGKKNSNLDRLALDWFNPGFLKMDREFTWKLNNPRVMSLVKHTVALCAENKIKFVVEGVENETQLRVLKSLGVIYMQGYYLGMPKEIPDVFVGEEKKFYLA